MRVIIGPYIGGLEQELFTFRPYATWIYNCLLPQHDCDFYISSHENHKFMYDWPDATYIPVDRRLSNDDDHNGIINSKINNKDYLNIVKQLKNNVSGIDTVHCYVRYTKYDNFTIPISKKMYIPITTDTHDREGVFVINRNDETAARLVDMIDCIEINTISHTEDVLGMLLSAKLVVCPCGEWTHFCNVHKIPVFSWGTNIGAYKPGGVYYFDNFKSCVVFYDGNNINSILSGIEYTKNI